MKKVALLLVLAAGLLLVNACTPQAFTPETYSPDDEPATPDPPTDGD